MFDLIVVGSGIYGVTAALALNRRGRRVMVIDPGPVPHPLAATTDISKVVRMEYGRDELYMTMVEAALPVWRQWNETLNETLFHETGVLMVTRQPMSPGGFEYESYQMLLRRGHKPERMEASTLAHRFGAWRPDSYVDGFFHQQGGYAESGRVLAALVRKASEEGVAFQLGSAVGEVVRQAGRVAGVRTDDGILYSAGELLVAAGAWTQVLLPELAPVMKASGHPVFHLEVRDAAAFTPPDQVVFTADIARSGWYGFPLHPREGVVKIANHGVGRLIDPVSDERVVDESDVVALRRFLEVTFPELMDAPIVYTRRCLYSDTLDEHFWIDRHPEVQGLSVAAGGSGHGFKFAPVLGDLIADAVEGVPNPWLSRFRWRDLSGVSRGQEAARFHG